MKYQAFPLVFLRNGKTGKVMEFAGGGGMCRRLMEMGIFKGSVVKVIRNDGSGPMIISVGEERLALGRGISMKILVQESI